MARRAHSTRDPWTKDQYRALLEAAPDALLVVDRTGTIVFVNPRTSEVFGYSEEELLGQKIELLIPERFRAEHVAHREAFSRQPRARPMGVGMTLHGRLKDGREIPVEVSLSPLAGERGGWVATTVRDVSQRLEVEHSLQAARVELDSRRVLETLLGNLPGMVYRCRNDPDWTLEFVSEGVLELTGYPPQDLLSSRVTFGKDLIHADDRDRVWSEVQQAIDRGVPFDLVYRIHTADGRVKQVWERGCAVHADSGLQALEGFICDVTPRVRAEDELRRSERRYEALAHLSPVGIFRTDERGRNVYANRRLCELCGRSALEVQGEGWAATVHPEDRPRVVEEWREAVAHRRPFRCEHRFLHADGRVVHALAEAAPESDSDGRLLGYVGTLTDLTEQKHAAERLRLVERSAQEKARLADIGAIAAGVAHDMGNSLGGLLLHVQLIARSADRNDPIARVRDSVDQVIATVRHLESLVASFRNFAREQRLLRSPVHPGPLLEEVAEHWRPAGAARGVTLQIEVPRNPLPPVEADEPKLRRVLDNLVKNAIEAVDGGRGSVTLSARAMRAGTLRFTVSDSGGGIEQGIEPFRMFESSKSDGSGLGLAICRQIVQAHGGHVSFESLDPCGTAFHVDLPLAGPC